MEENPTYQDHTCYKCEDCEETDITPPDEAESCWTLEGNCCLSLDGCYTYVDPAGESLNIFGAGM